MGALSVDMRRGRQGNQERPEVRVVIRHSNIVIDRAAGTIAVGSCHYKFQHTHGSRSYVRKGTSVAFETFAYLLLNGHSTRKQLFDFVYGHDKEGGPVDGPSIFDVHFVNWSHIFCALGVELCREWKSGTQYLFLKSLPYD